MSKKVERMLAFWSVVVFGAIAIGCFGGFTAVKYFVGAVAAFLTIGAVGWFAEVHKG